MGICQSSEDQPAGAGGATGDSKDKKAGGGMPSATVEKIGKAARVVKSAGAHHVRNIFATPFEMMDLTKFKPPVHERTKEESKFIEDALKKNIVFEEMSAKEIRPLVLAFEETSAEANAEIIKQGDEGTYFYILKRGNVAFEVGGNEVGRAKEGASFGELALLYNCPRAATVRAIDAVTLLRVDQKV